MKKVLVFGGTHGNEWTGIWLVKKYGDYFKKKYPSLGIEFIIANPEAHTINKRFKDEDLNRAFQYLNESRPDSYEHNRAREIQKKILSEKCFVIDLHTTTSAMGKTLILTDYNPLVLWLAKEILTNIADSRVIGSPDPYKKYLASQVPASLMIEVGPVANGVIEPHVLEGTYALLDQLLLSLSTAPECPEGEIEVYVEVEDVQYPLDKDGQISAYIHSGFQGKDFIKVDGNYTPFRHFSGPEMTLKTLGPRYPIFINEAAYYPLHLAYTLCEKKIIKF
jgi:succinylglutamate desuccinylase